MELNLSLISPELEEETLHDLTLELCKLINRETDITAHLPPASPQAGTKGDIVTIGQIVLAFIGSGGVAVALVQVLKAFIERGRTLEIELERKDGVKVKIKGDNVSSGSLERTIELVREVVGRQNE